jgi:hypothetical protein
MKPCATLFRILTLAMTAVVTACGGGSSSPSVSNPNDPVTIQSYTVTGTSAAVNGVAPINPGVNNGQFSAIWTVTGNTIYTVRIAVSTDTIYDGNDIDIVNGGCGKANVADNCHTTGTVNCTFNNANIIACSDLVAAFPTRDLSVFLSGGIPMNAYLVVRACNPPLTSCPTAAVPIQIQ